MTEVQTYLTPAVTSMLEDDDEKGGVCDGSIGETRFFLPLKVCFYYLLNELSRWVNDRPTLSRDEQVADKSYLRHHYLSPALSPHTTKSATTKSTTFVTNHRVSHQPLSPRNSCHRHLSAVESPRRHTLGWVSDCWQQLNLRQRSPTSTAHQHVYCPPLWTVSFKLPCLFNYGSFCLNYEYCEFPAFCRVHLHSSTWASLCKQYIVLDLCLLVTSYMAVRMNASTHHKSWRLQAPAGNAATTPSTTELLCHSPVSQPTTRVRVDHSTLSGFWPQRPAVVCSASDLMVTADWNMRR